MNRAENKTCPDFGELLKVAAPDCPLSERERFTRRLKDCAQRDELMEGVWLFLLDHQFDYDQLFQFLKHNEKSLQKGAPILNAPRFSKWAVAASLIISIGLFSIFIHDIRIKNRILKHQLVDIGLPVFASGTREEICSRMMNHYRLKEYEQADSFIQEAVAGGNMSDTLWYYGGLIAFQLGQYETAIQRLEELQHYPESEFMNKSVFHKAVTLLMIKQQDKAVILLESLSGKPDKEIQSTITALRADAGVWRSRILW